MSQPPSATGPHAREHVFHCLSDHRRRQVLSLVYERDGPVNERELVAELTARSPELDADSPKEPAQSGAAIDFRQRLRLKLRHAHLPLLVEAGLLEWDRKSKTVTPTSHPAADDEFVTAHLNRCDRSWDEFAAVLAHRRRRFTLSVTARSSGSVDVDALASKIVTYESELGYGLNTRDSIHLSLCHQHLPHLVDAGLLEWDREAGTVEYTGSPELEETWFRPRMKPSARSDSLLVDVPL